MKKVRGINMFIQEQYLELARKIHRENPVVDAHFDLAAEVYERRLTGESGVVEQRYLPHFQEAGLNILVSSIYLTNRDLPELGLRKALGQITALKEDLEPVSDRIRVTASRAELERTGRQAGSQFYCPWRASIPGNESVSASDLLRSGRPGRRPHLEPPERLCHRLLHSGSV